MRQLIQTTPFPAFWLLLQPHDETAKGGCFFFSCCCCCCGDDYLKKNKKMFTLTGTRTPPPGAPDEPELD
jgi:hypothetical protein